MEKDIENKITSLKEKLNLTNRHENNEKLTKKEKSRLINIFRDDNKLLARKSDLMEMKSYIDGAILIYENKIKISNTRKEYRRQNRKYELYRGSFYRYLEVNPVNDDVFVKTEDIAEFWSKMWCRA